MYSEVATNSPLCFRLSEQKATIFSSGVKDRSPEILLQNLNFIYLFYTCFCFCFTKNELFVPKKA